MSEIDSLAFHPGQQVRCKTRFNDILTGEVIAFDLRTKILTIKSVASDKATSTATPPTLSTTNTVSSTTATNTSASNSNLSISSNGNLCHIHFLVLDSCSDVEILKDHQQNHNDYCLPSIDMSYIEKRKNVAKEERLKLVEAFKDGVSKDGLLLFGEVSKKYSVKDVIWRDKNKIVVLNQVVISPPYRECNCQSLNSKSSNDAVPYIKKVVSHYWETKTAIQNDSNRGLKTNNIE